MTRKEIESAIVYMKGIVNDCTEHINRCQAAMTALDQAKAYGQVSEDGHYKDMLELQDDCLEAMKIKSEALSKVEMLIIALNKILKEENEMLKKEVNANEDVVDGIIEKAVDDVTTKSAAMGELKEKVASVNVRVKAATETAAKRLSESAVGRILSADPDAAYELLVKEINKAAMSLAVRGKKKDAADVKGAANVIVEEEGKVEDKKGFKHAVVVFFKKAAELVFGLGKFVCHASIIALTMVARVAKDVVVEVGYAGREVGRSFNADVVSVFKK